MSDLIEASTEQAARSAGARWPARSPGRSTRCATGWSSCACWSRRRSIFPRKRSTSSNAPMHAGGWRASSPSSTACWSARSGARCARACAWCWRAAQRRQELAAQRAGRRRAGHRHADPGHDARQGQRDHPDPRRAGACDRHRRAARPRGLGRRSRAHRHRAQLGRDRTGRRRAVPARPHAPGRA